MQLKYGIKYQNASPAVWACEHVLWKGPGWVHIGADVQIRTVTVIGQFNCCKYVK